MSGNAFKDFNPKRVDYDDYIVLKVIVEHFFKNIAEIDQHNCFVMIECMTELWRLDLL